MCFRTELVPVVLMRGLVHVQLVRIGTEAWESLPIQIATRRVATLPRFAREAGA